MSKKDKDGPDNVTKLPVSTRRTLKAILTDGLAHVVTPSAQLILEDTEKALKLIGFNRDDYAEAKS